MKRRNVLIIAGIVLVIVVIGAVVGFSYLQSLLAPKPLDITYSTEQIALPEVYSCAGGREDSPGIAKEILNLETDDIFVAGGTNAMPDDVWQNYSFRLPIVQNSTRNLMFNGSCFFRSPDVPVDCEGEACFTIETIVDYTWLKLTTIVGQSCFPDANGCSGDVVNAGYVSINTIAKCHHIVYDSDVIYELSDGNGNLYVMHATATGTPDLNAALPTGWTLTERPLDEPLVLLPFGGGDNCYYNVVRDNLVQSYHQYAYSGETYPPMQ
jgi:hypothetical protein